MCLIYDTMRFPLLTLLLLALLTGCDSTRSVDFDAEVVVQSFQAAGEPMQPVRLTQTAPLDVAYDAAAFALEGAEVAVDELDGDGAVVRSIAFREEQDGRYVPEEEVIVQPLTRYRLRAEVPVQLDLDQAVQLRTETLVPGAFELAAEAPDTIVYNSAERLTARVTRSEYPGRQSVFVFTTEAIGPLTVERITNEFFRQLVDEGSREEVERELERLRLGSSPLINEQNYEENADGTLTIPLPWIAVPWFGDTIVNASAVDENLRDFLRSEQTQTQGGTLAPGEIPNLIDHVEGGIGVFGSYARVSFDLHVVSQ